MPKQRKTSPKVARIASKLLKSKRSSSNTKKVAASAMSQRAPKRKRK